VSDLFDELFDEPVEGDGLTTETDPATGKTTVKVDGVTLAVLTEDEKW
jgi:hypothetical protein